MPTALQLTGGDPAAATVDAVVVGLRPAAGPHRVAACQRERQVALLERHGHHLERLAQPQAHLVGHGAGYPGAAGGTARRCAW